MQRRRVLVVDDDVDIRESLTEVLRYRGYDVLTAYDGQDALDVLHRHVAPGLIILDWMMPRMDAPQFRAQQQLESTLAHIPVVIMTANARSYAKTRALEAVDYLSKPVEVRKLLQTVDRHCLPACDAHASRAGSGPAH